MAGEQTTTAETIDVTMEDVAALIGENPNFKVMLQNVALRRMLRELTAEIKASDDDESKAKPEDEHGS